MNITVYVLLQIIEPYNKSSIRKKAIKIFLDDVYLENGN